MTLHAHGDTGTLIPRDKQAPDPSILSLEEMRVEIVVDNGDAHVSIIQIFANHTNKVEEGTYRFSLPGGSTVSDFAVWDGVVRIPAVILERKRAEQLYDEAKSQAIDPGLLEGGERDDQRPKEHLHLHSQDRADSGLRHKASGDRVSPASYRVTNFKQGFILSLKPDGGQKQAVRSFSLHFVLHSAHGIEGFSTASRLFPLAYKV